MCLLKVHSTHSLRLQIGFGPISWLMVSEVFPQQIRGTAIGAAVVVNFGVHLGVTYSYGYLKDAITTQGTFWMFAGFCVLSIAFVFVCVPETKGRSLEQIQDEMRDQDRTQFKNNSFHFKTLEHTA